MPTMTPERWKRVKQVFLQAVDLDPQARETYLKAACGDDQMLRDQVQQWLEHHERAEADGFLKRISGDSVQDVETAVPSESKLVGRSGSHQLSGQFGRYHIVKLLGQGGMGVVYLALDPQLDRQVAIKVPFFAADDHASVLNRFRREAKAIAAIQHPNICPIHEVAEADGVPFMAMAYISGKPLSRFIKPDNPLPIRAVLMTVRKLALALEVAHKRGVIHRDLKPANIMINELKEPVIMDFGLARREGNTDTQLTRTGQAMGTPSYMPPEQVSGDLEAMGPGCDIYSLGVILYQLLTGRLPFQGDLLSVLSQIANDAPEPPSQYREEIDAELDQICLNSMAKKVEDRFSTMGEFAKALSEHLKMLSTLRTASAEETLPVVERDGPSWEVVPPPITIQQPSLDGNPFAQYSPQAAEPPPITAQQCLPDGNPFATSSSETEVKPPVSVRRPGPPARPKRPTNTVARQRLGKPVATAAVLILAAILGFAILFTIKTPYGTIVVEAADGEDLQVAVLRGGTEISVIDAEGDWTIKLEEGQYSLAIKGGDDRFELDPKTIKVVDDQQVKVTITMIGDDSQIQWTPLFNGRDLTGWTPMLSFGPTFDQHRPASAGWEVQSSDLVCTTDQPGWLKSEKQYGDFEFELEFKVVPGANSGIIIRSPGEGHLSTTGMEVQIVDETTKDIPFRDDNRTGAIWGVAGPDASLRVLRPLGAWNHLRVRCQGDHVEVDLNSRQTVAIDMTQVEPLRSRPRSGYIGLYNWKGQAKGIEFRNIRVQELTAADAAAQNDFPMSGLVLHVDPSRAEEVLAADQSGRGNYLFPCGDGNRVVLTENVINGLSAFTFNNGQSLGPAQNADFESRNFSIFVVVHPTEFDAWNFVVGKDSYGYGAGYGIEFHGNALGAYVARGPQDRFSDVAPNQTYILSAVKDDNAIRLWVDGTLGSTDRNLAGFDSKQHEYRIGNSDNSWESWGFTGHIGEILHYNRNLADAERQVVEDYLTRKWKGRQRRRLPRGPRREDSANDPRPSRDAEVPEHLEVAEVGLLVAAMDKIDRAYNNLKLCGEANWRCNSAQMDPAKETRALQAGFAEARRDAVGHHDQQFISRIIESQKAAALLENALNRGDFVIADEAFRKIGSSCRNCHQIYRTE